MLYHLRFPKYTLALFLYVFLFSSVSAQKIVLSGKVLSQSTKQEISQVNIYVKDSKIGTTSNKDGTFKLVLFEDDKNIRIVFEHIGYKKLLLTAREIEHHKNIFLIPTTMTAAEINIEAQRHTPKIEKDIPQPISIIDHKRFEIQGYIDSGDLLKTDHSIQVDETISGKKTISIRGGNSDDVIVLYNGIRMNNIYDNVFDFSLIELSDVKLIEVIKGSNSALYGSDAFSGVVNIVPRIYKDYLVKFQQRFGTYNSGDWNLSLNKKLFDRLNLSYSYKQGASKRDYINPESDSDYLKNTTRHHSANIDYQLSADNSQSSHIGLNYFQTAMKHQDYRYNEFVSNNNKMIIFSYSGNELNFQKFNVSAAYQNFNAKQSITAYQGVIDRTFLNDSYFLTAEKSARYKNLELLFAYQFQKNKVEYQNQRNIQNETAEGVESADFFQDRHGLASIIKLHAPTDSELISAFDIDFSYRFDYVNNQQKNIFYRESSESQVNPGNTDWKNSTVKMSTFLSGGKKNLHFNTYLNYGTNIKFPSILQQISTPESITPNSDFITPNLSPEKNRSYEIGGDFINNFDNLYAIESWKVSLSYFKNFYENKFRMFYLPSSPVAFFDNVQTASISGFDIKAELFFLKDIITIETGISRYQISAKAAFPFKSDYKNIVNLLLDLSNYHFQFHWFKEGAQVGVIRTSSGNFVEKSIPGYTNIDLHLNKAYNLKYVKLFANFSARNLLDTELDIEGIALRDRRFYLTFGIQY